MSIATILGEHTRKAATATALALALSGASPAFAQDLNALIWCDHADPALLQPFVDAAVQLAGQGAAMITTSCGFLSVFQQELAAAVSVPVLTSALAQVPLAASAIGRDQRVGILT